MKTENDNKRMNKHNGPKIIIRIILLIYVTIFYCMSEGILIKKTYKSKEISSYNKLRIIYWRNVADLTSKIKKYKLPLFYINVNRYINRNVNKNILYYDSTRLQLQLQLHEKIVTNEKEMTAVKPKLKKKEKKILKKYKNLLDLIPNKKDEYNIIEAIEKIKNLAVHKFVESIDMYLSFSAKKSKMTKNDNIKTYITFPHNLKKKRDKKVYVITNREMQQAALDAGGDIVGEDDVINKIKEREIRLQKKNTNFLICTNDVIHKVTRIGKDVGRKGLMPNEKCGTLVNTILLTKHINLFKFQNTYIFKLNKLNTLNINVGDVYMSNDEIRENICYLFEYLDNLEFFHFNFKNLKTMYLNSTMGFSFKKKKNFL